MKNKYQLILLNITITFLSLYFTYLVYEEYKYSQKIKIDNYINKSIKMNKNIIKNTFTTIKKEIEKDKEIFKTIHIEYTKKLRENITYDLDKLKIEIQNKYNLKDKDIHLFLLNNKYTVTHSTYPTDIGFNLTLVPDARIELDRSNDGKIHQSDSISIDIINSEIKSYSYSKINNDLYFEMGFINKKIHNILKIAMAKIQLMTNKNSKLYRIEQKLDGSEYYDNIMDKNSTSTKEKYLQSKKKFLKNQVTKDNIILANRTGQIQEKHFLNHSIYYIPLIKKDNIYLKLMGDFVLELYIDRSSEKNLLKKIKNYFYIFFLFHLFFLFNIYYFTLKYYKAQKRLENKVKGNNLLLEENKSFIEAMTNQIKTPLSVIMSNFLFIEKYINKNLKHYSNQINSAINMMNNSYKDLTYIVENEKVNYLKEKIDLSDFLKQRISFFNTIAKSKNKNISYDIEENVVVNINKTEIERLIDNNLSNAIKYGDKSNNIFVTLRTIQNTTILKFYSNSNKIKNKNKIFDKNYQEQKNGNKSLGLGLSMVKHICDKNNIIIDVEYRNQQNIFVYILKNNIRLI